MCVCFALIAYSVKQNFDADQARIEQGRIEDCKAANGRRADAKKVAESDVDSDEAIWNAIDDLLIDGIPEPARTTIFAGLDARRAVIAVTYAEVNCEPLDNTATA